MGTVVSRVGESGVRPALVAENDPLFEDLTLTEWVDVACSPEAAYDLVSDVSRIGEFSPECVRAEWVSETTFEGTNRVAYGDDEYLWVRPCTVVVAERPREWSYVVGDKYDGTPATSWSFSFAPLGEGCRITQTFRHLPRGLSGLRLQADADPSYAAGIVEARGEALREGMRATLSAMARVLET